MLPLAVLPAALGAAWAFRHLHELAPAVQAAALVLTLSLRKEIPVRTTLESGAWIEHVPIQDLKGKHIRDYARAGKSHIDGSAVDDEGTIDVRAIVTGTDIGEQQQVKHDALWAIVITGWSYPLEVPKYDRGQGQALGAEVLEEIPADDYAQIDELLEPFAKKLAGRPNQNGATTPSSSASSKAKASGSHRG